MGKLSKNEGPVYSFLVSRNKIKARIPFSTMKKITTYLNIHEQSHCSPKLCNRWRLVTVDEMFLNIWSKSGNYRAQNYTQMFVCHPQPSIDFIPFPQREVLCINKSGLKKYFPLQSFAYRLMLPTKLRQSF